MFRRVENKVKRREVKRIPEKNMVSLPGGGGRGLGARAESPPGLLLTRNILSGKGESRQRGDRKPQRTFAAELVPLFRLRLYPRYNNPAKL